MTTRRNILFVHQNFPGQFPHIAEALRARGDRVAAIGSKTARNLPGIDVRRWSNARSTTPGILPVAVRAEADLIRAEAAAHAARQLRADGFVPDLIVGHPGWGETIHMKGVFPNARMIVLGEYYYDAKGRDVDFDPEFPRPDDAEAMRQTALNACQLLSYVQADRIVCPTPFQATLYPPVLTPAIRVLHEGIDIAAASRKPGARIRTKSGRTIDGSRPVITYVSRTLEPVRGFHIFMRALPAVLAAVPDADVLVIGNPGKAGYGRAAPGEGTWKGWIEAELGDRLPADRVHFLGRVDHADMIRMLSLSWAHVYLTYPFTLSWSLLEAMACECLIIGSDTAPVRDAVTAGETGLLVDFFDVDALAATIADTLRDPGRYAPLRAAAREAVVSRFDRAGIGVPCWLALIDEVLNG